MADPSLTITIDAAKLAREVAAELHRLKNARIRRICDELAAERAAEQNAADGLDDQDGPAVRARLYAELHDGPVLTWAHLPSGGWRYVGLDGWHRDDFDGAPDCTVEELIPLGWVEIPASAIPAAGEEKISG